jgi:hypothetical protein
VRKVEVLPVLTGINQRGNYGLSKFRRQQNAETSVLILVLFKALYKVYSSLFIVYFIIMEMKAQGTIGVE